MRGQVAIEYMIILIFFFVGLISVAALSVQHTYSVKVSEDTVEAKGLLDRVARGINTAYLEGNGFSTTVTLPQTIFGYNYSLDLVNGVPILYFRGKTFSSFPVPQNVTGNLSKGVNRIENINSQIVVSSA